MLGLYAMSWPNIRAQNPSVLTYRAYPNVLQSSCTTILADFVNKELNVLLKIEIIFIALKLRTRAEVFYQGSTELGWNRKVWIPLGSF